ncbi:MULTISPECIES: Ldh family oxidoreductase [Agrobacterium]|uniref:Oxidoreductase n=1 Tax=Agrobacterium rosae TaxID=1972867 RepID=A0A1R3TFE6_9HYPH|nr:MULTISPECIES: Ldh family oxidoreductase [Agrobacterium]KAA3515809.1 Ldh family oxidoreductase [Agrobacterium rosae]KAA3524766.1 Ldh family oxidoreductase [Agrobacterium rosae]MBN7803888.1 Ldh family oxidoreductase [Agrobacterium rosae]MCM2431720.1 Ldh family oxidoreductase [Agrobacterium rosae]MDX8328614.1 Ldh family oxidoreductase [Agrobacterium rosae]
MKVPLSILDRFCRAVFAAAGANTATADAASRAMMHGTRHGVDSHGVRLLDHYISALEGGRINRSPNLKRVAGFGAVETLDADNAHGALSAYTAMDRATKIAETFGIGAVAIRNTSHFGPAGAYSFEAAKKGFIGITFCNSDSFVRLHDGATRFHGTNPISVGVPVAGENPWLLDMATSSIPYNRVLLYRSLGQALPQATASDAGGHDTLDADAADMLAPLGGEFGFKGAALAGVAEIFSAVLTGMKLSFDIPPMGGPDFSKPRGLGAFVLALKPEAFVEKEIFDEGMQRYLHALRSSAARQDCHVMAPGDREWAVAAEREETGVLIDPATRDAFLALGKRFGVRVLGE